VGWLGARVNDGVVATDSSGSSAEPEEVQWVDFGPEPGPDVLTSDGWRWRWWYAALALVVLATVVVVHGQQRRSHANAQATPARSSSTSRSVSPPVVSTQAAATVPGSAPAVVDVGHPLLAVASDWELFGDGASGLVRVELKRGVITTTALPLLDGGGPLSLVVGPSSVVVRPYDDEPGYLVPDGKPASTIDSPSGNGAAVPGPDLNHYWTTDANGTSMTLVAFDGDRTKTTVAIPYGVEAISDGAGYLMFTGTSGVYDLRPTGSQRITTGTVLAAGPTRWLISECDGQYRCSTYVIDRSNGSRRVIAEPGAAAFFAGNGVISPDGNTAAVLESPSGAAPTIHLVDLRTGKDRDTNASVDISLGFGQGTFVWSPDDQWLFVAGSGQRLQAIEVAANRVIDLGVQAHVTQVALRTSGS
jgi:hypothetical protein